MAKKSKANKNKRSDEDKARIRELTLENQRLRREIASLKGEIERGTPSTKRLLRKRDAIESTFTHQARRNETYSEEGFFAYFIKALKNASFFRIYKDILYAVRHFAFVTTTIQIILIILTVLKSSAILLISTSAFIVALPFIFLFSAIGTALTVFGSRRATRINRPLVKDKDVYVFLPAKKSAIRPDSYFAGFVRETSAAPNRLCVIVTQGFFFSRGISKKRRYYFTSRKEDENIIIVRRHYYYKFKNKIAIPEARSVNEIY